MGLKWMEGVGGIIIRDGRGFRGLIGDGRGWWD